MNDVMMTKINQIVVLEERLQMLKEMETEIKKEKEDLRQLMITNDLKKWETPNGTKITLVEDAPDEEIEVRTIDEEKFAEENIQLHNDFMDFKKKYEDKRDEYATVTTEIKTGRKGYVRITLPKLEGDK